MPEVSELFIYPIKSLRGISLKSADVTDRGFQYDRRWMLVDSNNSFITQRDLPEMCLMQVSITESGLSVEHRNGCIAPLIPFELQETSTQVEVWSDQCKAVYVSSLFDEWFSDMLSVDCRLVYMPDSTKRRVDTRYATKNEITSFSDGYPFLLIGQSSLDDLNDRLPSPIPIDRFRPNIVFTGGEPYEEDLLANFSIGDVRFYGVKLCARCVITTIDQNNAERSGEPLATLASYRIKNNRIYFGQNLLHEGTGTITVGDKLLIHERKTLAIHS